MTITEQAVPKMLEFMEVSVPRSLQIKEGGSDMPSTLEGNENFNKMRAVVENTRTFSKDTAADAGILHGHVTETLMAQEYPNSARPIVIKLIEQVQEVKNDLPRIIKITGSAYSTRRVARSDVESGGSYIPGVGGRLVREGRRDDVDSLLASLGF